MSVFVCRWGPMIYLVSEDLRDQILEQLVIAQYRF